VAVSTASRRAALPLRPESFSNGKLFREIPRVENTFMSPSPASGLRRSSAGVSEYHRRPDVAPGVQRTPIGRAYGATDKVCIFLPRHARGISRREIAFAFLYMPDLAIDEDIFLVLFRVISGVMDARAIAELDSAGSVASIGASR